MRDNGPTTGIERQVPPGAFLVSRTDTSGRVTSANDTFISICGFNRSELVGQPHNLVRHPDMPAAAFADLWTNLAAGRCWVGTVKNRCKDGGHYWVRAAVSPTMLNGRVVEYVSVRVPPTEIEKHTAEAVYATMRAGGGARLHRGRICPAGAAWLVAATRGIAGRSLLALAPTGLAAVAGLVMAFRGDTRNAAYCWVAALILALGGLLVARWILHARLGAVGADLDRLARGEDVFLDLDRSDELQDVVLAVASLQTHLKAASLDLAESHRNTIARFDDQIGPALKDLNEVVQQLGGSATTQAKQAEEVSTCTRSVASATTELGASIGEIARQASRADRLASETRQQTEDGLQAACRLTKTANEISDVTRVIEAIANQTNLLALNATIEAASAGQYGRGFAIVASEVKMLAGQARNATADISKRLAAVQIDVTAVNTAMQSIVGATQFHCCRGGTADRCQQ